MVSIDVFGGDYGKGICTVDTKELFLIFPNKQKISIKDISDLKIDEEFDNVVYFTAFIGEFILKAKAAAIDYKYFNDLLVSLRTESKKVEPQEYQWIDVDRKKAQLSSALDLSKCSPQELKRENKRFYLVLASPFIILILFVAIIFVYFSWEKTDRSVTFNTGQICKATIAEVMGKDPSIINIYKVDGGIIFTSYNRPSDNTTWKNRCRVDTSSDTVIWATLNGRWRNGPNDSTITYGISDDEVTIYEKHIDGSISASKFDYKNL